MARGNLEMSAISAFDISKLVPEFSIFTAGYVAQMPTSIVMARPAHSVQP